MNDAERIEASVRRMTASLRVLLKDQSMLIVADTIDAAREAMTLARSLVGVVEDALLRDLVELVRELTLTLAPLVPAAAVSHSG